MLCFSLPIEGPGQCLGKSWYLDSRGPLVLQSAGPVPVQPVSYFCQLATNGSSRPVIDPKGPEYEISCSVNKL